MKFTLNIFSIFLLIIVFISDSYAGNGDDKEPMETHYVKLQHSIVSNLTGGPKYIRCDVQLMTHYASNVPELELHMPAIRHSILMLLAGADGKQLLTPEGKEALRKQALQAVNETLKKQTGDTQVDDLYFTAYYVK